MLAVTVLAFYGMWRGWRRRVRHGHPDLPPLPAPPETGERGRVLVPAVPGLYVGTVTAEDWLDRVAAEGLSLRATGRLQVSEQGALIERDGGEPVWLPVAALRSVRIAEALAGHVMGPAGLLVDRLAARVLRARIRLPCGRPGHLPPLITALRAILPADGAGVALPGSRRRARRGRPCTGSGRRTAGRRRAGTGDQPARPAARPAARPCSSWRTAGPSAVRRTARSATPPARPSSPPA